MAQNLKRHKTLKQKTPPSASPAAEWPLPVSATLGSAVRAKGIEREIRARLPWELRRCVAAEVGRIVLHMQKARPDVLGEVSASIVNMLESIEELPVLPREVEDILTISSRERHKWLKDGRLKSIGTRTVKLRGRSKAVTFHVFDPRHIEDVLDRDLPALWRDEDVRNAAETRRRAGGKAALTRAGKGTAPRNKKAHGGDAAGSKLQGWDAFQAKGLLR